MANWYKTAMPCHQCGTMTHTHRTRDNKPQCLQCGIVNATAFQREIIQEESESRRINDQQFLDWVDGGGIERADSGQAWKRSMRKRAERLRKASGLPPSDMSLPDSP